MKSTMPLGISNRPFLRAFTVLVLVLACSQVLAQKGYLGKRHWVGVDLVNPFYQDLYKLDYRLTLAHEKIGIGITAGYYHSDHPTSYKKIQRDEDFSSPPIYRSQRSIIKGPELGVEFGGTFRGLPYPLGHGAAVGIKGSFLRMEDRYQALGEQFQDLEKSFHFKSRTISFYGRYFRNFHLTKSLRLGLELEFGIHFYNASFDWNKGDRAEWSEFESPRPLRVLPKHFHISRPADFSQENITGMNHPMNGSNSFYLLPLVKFAYQF